MSNKVFIVSGCRTPIGSFQGQFEKYSAVELGVIAIKEAISRANIQPEDVEQCIMGQILTAGQGQNPARQASVGASIPYSAPAYTINMLCGSGLKSVILGYQAIRDADSSIVVAGGQESMTRAEHTAYLRGQKFGSLNLADSLLQDGLLDVFGKTHMGDTANYLATKWQVPRSVQDTLAFNSHRKAVDAAKNGYFNEEIVGVPDKRTQNLIAKDESPKPDCTIEKLTKLRLAFDQQGTVTAGNASSLSDGAAAVVVASEGAVKEKRLSPLAEIIGYAEVGEEPMNMGLAPIRAVEKLLKKVGWTKDEVDLYELNEAFAVQTHLCTDQLGLEPDKVNVNGGAIALGHPLGASGTRCLVTLIYNLKRLGKKKGVVSLCIGGGMGIAMAIQIC